MSMSLMNRRQFIAAAGLGTGYNLLVRAPQVLADTTSPTPEQIRQRIDELSPPQSGPATPEPNMRQVDLTTDVLVAGGGMAGVCAALAAAREGARVILVQDRSRLGGNASSEIKMHIIGADRSGHRPGWRETGLIEELRLENACWNPHSAFELWDLLLYDKCVSEPNLTLILDTAVYRAEVADGKIQAVWARCDKTEHLYRISASIFVDATGDCRLALEAGAEMRVGRESPQEFGEDLADFDQAGTTQGSSILFTACRHDKPMPFKPPTWARHITADDLKLRKVDNFEYGYWWIELGGVYDTIRDNERLRFELLAIVLGVWDYIKNSGNVPDSENWALQTLGMIPGKRESRRVMGDVILTQSALQGGWHDFKDAVAIGGWPMDDHPAMGFDAPEKKPSHIVHVEPYNIAFGALYSRNIANLMMAGRNISCSHVAFTSTRVMATCAAMGQAVGTAAAQCAAQKIQPKQIRDDQAKMTRLQQRLLRNDQSIRELANTDPDDLARTASVSASSSAEGTQPGNILSGVTRDLPGEFANRWIGKLDDGGTWIELTWKQPQKIGCVQITFDTGLHRALAITASIDFQQRMIIGPQPECPRDYTLTAVGPDGKSTQIAAVTGNIQRLCRHVFDPQNVSSLRLTITAGNGDPQVGVYEIRCYESA